MADRLDNEPDRPEHRHVSWPTNRPADIAGSARRIGAYVWVSSRLFEVVGDWATTSGSDVERVAYARAASRFAWQAGEWRRRLPVLAEVDVDRLVEPPDAVTATGLERFAVLGDAERGRALVDVLAELDDLYRADAETASELRDGAVLRSIRRVRADLADLAVEVRDM